MNLRCSGIQDLSQSVQMGGLGVGIAENRLEVMHPCIDRTGQHQTLIKQALTGLN